MILGFNEKILKTRLEQGRSADNNTLFLVHLGILILMVASFCQRKSMLEMKKPRTGHKQT